MVQTLALKKILMQKLADTAIFQRHVQCHNTAIVWYLGNLECSTAYLEVSETYKILPSKHSRMNWNEIVVKVSDQPTIQH